MRIPVWTALIVLGLGGCKDMTGVSSQGKPLPIGDASKSEYPNEGEYNPALVSVDVDAIAWFTAGGQPRGAAQTLFGMANRVKQTLELSVYFDGSEIASTSPKISGFAQFLPYSGTISDTTAINYAWACGASSTSTANSEAEIRLMVSSFAWASFGTKYASDNGNGYMNPCPPPPENCYLSRIFNPTTSGVVANYEECQEGEAPTPPVGGRGENGTQVCYTVWREYWEIDLENGTWEFLYEEPIGTVCYQNGLMT